MPTSNGQVTSRDIRQSSVKTLHILDEAITAAKIPDLEITYPDKLDDPVWVEVQAFKVNSSFTLTTTRTTAVTVTVDVPAWVDQLSVFGIGEAQLTNTSGAETLLSVVMVVDGSDVNGISHEIADNSTQHVSSTVIHSVIGVAGSSVDVDIDVYVSAGSHSSHNEELYVLAVGSR